MGGRLTPTIRALLIAEAAIYAVYLFVRPLRPAMIGHLALGPGFFAGEIWQPLTALFVHLDPSPLIFSLLGIWWAGEAVERARGTRRMVGLFLVGGVLANLAFAEVGRHLLYGAGAILGGASFAVLTLFVAFGKIYGRTPMQLLGGFQIQARYLAIAFVAWNVVAALAGPAVDWASLAATAVAAAVGYFGAASGGLEALWEALKIRRLRRRYRVIEGGAGRPPKNYMN
jgi:membrane associated rhomboid family serine protease